MCCTTCEEKHKHSHTPLTSLFSCFFLFFFSTGLPEAGAGYRPPCPDPLRSSVYEARVSQRSSVSHPELDLGKVWTGRHWREGRHLFVLWDKTNSKKNSFSGLVPWPPRFWQSWNIDKNQCIPTPKSCEASRQTFFFSSCHFCVKYAPDGFWTYM